ncbi:hypothetical protein PM004_17535, partial [Clostridium paraputrificum]
GKLSSIAPMVLHGRLCGRVGRCQVIKRIAIAILFFYISFVMEQKINIYATFLQIKICTIIDNILYDI